MYIYIYIYVLVYIISYGCVYIVFKSSVTSSPPCYCTNMSLLDVAGHLGSPRLYDKRTCKACIAEDNTRLQKSQPFKSLSGSCITFETVI